MGKTNEDKFIFGHCLENVIASTRPVKFNSLRVKLRKTLAGLALSRFGYTWAMGEAASGVGSVQGFHKSGLKKRALPPRFHPHKTRKTLYQRGEMGCVLYQRGEMGHPMFHSDRIPAGIWIQPYVLPFGKGETEGIRGASHLGKKP